MSVFCYKKLAPSISLGCKFRQIREERGLNLEQLCRRLQIAPRYLRAIEEENYSALPLAKAYRFAYIREYADELGLPTSGCLEQFCRENGLSDTTPIHPCRSLRWSTFAPLSSILRLALLSSFILLFIGYLIWQINGIATPPKLFVYSPSEGAVVAEPIAVIQGETALESKLTINGQNIMLNERGQFETKVDLIPGVNTLSIISTKKHGKTTTITRHLVVQSPIK